MDWDKVMELNETELMALNRVVVSRINELRNMKARRNIVGFSVGDKIKFNSNRFGRCIHGTIIKINLKTVDVGTDTGPFRVPANMIKREDEDAKI